MRLTSHALRSIRFAKVGTLARYSERVASMIWRYSRLWLPGEPVAGLADSSWLIERANVPAKAIWRYLQAPMLLGSSWIQTTSALL